MTFLELLVSVLLAYFAVARSLPTPTSLPAPPEGCEVRGLQLCCTGLEWIEKCNLPKEASEEGLHCVKMDLVGTEGAVAACFHCHKHKGCVPLDTTFDEPRTGRSKRSTGPLQEDLPSPSGHFAIALVAIVAIAVSIFVLVLCAGGGTKAYDVEVDKEENPAPSNPAVEPPREHVQEEVQEAQIEIQDNPPAEVVVNGQQGEAPVNHEAEQQGENPGDEDDPAYDRVQGPVGNHDDPHQERGDVGGVKVSYGRVSRHPGQPPYASVSEVLPGNEAVGGEEGESSDSVAKETAGRGDYAEVQPPGGVKAAAVPQEGGEGEGYDEMLGYDSVRGSGSGPSSQDDRYDVVKPSGGGGGADDQAYAEVRLASSLPTSTGLEEPDRGRGRGGGEEVAPQLPPMRTRQQSGSEDDPIVSSGDRSSSVSKQRDGRGVDKGKASKEHSHHKEHSKEKSKGLQGLFRHRSATVAAPSKNKGSSVEEAAKEGPPLPPNHPQPNRFPLQGRPTPAVPSEDVEDFYDEPFDSAPSGRPRKVSSSAAVKDGSSAKGIPHTRSVSGSVSPSSKGFPQTPLPDIPQACEEQDPNYESVTPTMKRVAIETPNPDEEEETPYDTVPSDLAKTSRGKPPSKDDKEEEEETPYDVVDRTPVKSKGGVSKEEEDEEEETPYDTVVPIPGTMIPISTGVLASKKKKTSSDSEDPYSKVGPKNSEMHPYSTVNKVKGKSHPPPGEDPYSMPIDTVDTPHDEHGYAVVPEEYKRRRTVSKGAAALKKSKPISLETTYSTVNKGGTASPTPPISPIKDHEIIKEFCPPQTPPPLSISPEISQTTDTLTEGCHDNTPQVHQLTVSGSEGVESPPT